MSNRHQFITVAGIALLALLLTVYPPGTSQAASVVGISHSSAVVAPGANTDAISDITWGSSGNSLRLTVQCETATIVNLMVNDGTNEIDRGLNSNTPLVAGASYEFDFNDIRPGWVVNIQSETDTVWDTISVSRIK